MRLTLGILTLLLLLFLFFPLSSPPKLKVVDSLGNSLVFSTPPKRIVSLSPEMTLEVMLLGLSQKLVGKTLHCPKEAPGIVVGTLWRPNLEAILRLEPDLILATKEGNLQKEVQALKRAGLPVFVGGEKRNFTDIQLQYLLLAKLFGKEKLAREQIRKWEDTLGKLPSLPKKRVFFLLWTSPLIAVGPSSFLNHMISLAGGENICPKLGRYPRLSLEEVLRLQPEVLLVSEKVSLPSPLRSFPCIPFPDRFAIPSPDRFVQGVKYLHQRLRCLSSSKTYNTLQKRR